MPDPAVEATPAPAAVADSVDPWDEPADIATSDQAVDVGTAAENEVTSDSEQTPASDAVVPEPEPKRAEPVPAASEPTALEPTDEAKPAKAAFTGDPALLDEPDPWD